MNKYAEEILKLSYKNYCDTGEEYFEFQACSSRDFTYYDSAFLQLQRLKYINYNV